jgi:hypothetical protein
MAASWGGIYRALVWLMAPHPVAACLVLLPLLLIGLSTCTGGR